MLKVIGILILTTLFTVIILWMSKDVAPSSKLFEFKRLYETTILLSKRNPNDKVDYYLNLLDLRLNEMEIETKTVDSKIVSTSNRYSATAGNLTDLIITKNLVNKVAITKQKFLVHKKKLTQLSEKNINDNKGLINTSLDYLTINERKLNEYH